MRWERFGDLAVLQTGALVGWPWQSMGLALWDTVARALGVARLARQAPVAANGSSPQASTCQIFMQWLLVLVEDV